MTDRPDALRAPSGCPECGLVGTHNPRCASQWNATPDPAPDVEALRALGMTTVTLTLDEYAAIRAQGGGLDVELAKVRIPFKQGDLYGYGWNDAVAACRRAARLSEAER